MKEFRNIPQSSVHFFCASAVATGGISVAVSLVV